MIALQKKKMQKWLRRFFSSRNMSTIDDRSDEPVKFLCPSVDELSIIVNEVKCDECKLIFHNEPQFRMHDFKVHKRKNLGKNCKKAFFYHCPIKNCIYAPGNKKYFTLYKYLKQVSIATIAIIHCYIRTLLYTQ